MTILDAIRNLYTPAENSGRFTLPADFPAFDGHFPGQPVLPAVVQIMMAMHVISLSRGREYTLKEIKKAKFVSVIQAGDTIDIIINSQTDAFDVILKNESTVLSTFQIIAE